MGVLDELQAQQGDFNDQMGQVNDYLNAGPKSWGDFFSMNTLHQLAQAPQMYQHWRQALNDIPGTTPQNRVMQSAMGTEGAPAPAEAVGTLVGQGAQNLGVNPRWSDRIGTAAQYATEWTPIIGQGNAVGTGLTELGEGGLSKRGLWNIGSGLYDVSMGAYGPDLISLKNLITKGVGAGLQGAKNLPAALSNLRDYYSLGRDTGGGLMEFMRDEGHDILAHGAKTITSTPLGKEAVMHALGYKDEIERQYNNLFGGGDSGDYGSTAESQGQGGMPPPQVNEHPIAQYLRRMTMP